jgi:hypothetical protein
MPGAIRLVATGPDSGDHRPGPSVAERAIGRSGGRLGDGSEGWKRAAEAAHPDGEVVLHDLADLRLAQELVRREGRTRRGRSGSSRRRRRAQVLRRVGVVAKLAQAARQLGRRPSDGMRSPRISREIVE